MEPQSCTPSVVLSPDSFIFTVSSALSRDFIPDLEAIYQFRGERAKAGANLKTRKQKNIHLYCIPLYTYTAVAQSLGTFYANQWHFVYAVRFITKKTVPAANRTEHLDPIHINWICIFKLAVRCYASHQCAGNSWRAIQGRYQTR